MTKTYILSSLSLAPFVLLLKMPGSFLKSMLSLQLSSYICFFSPTGGGSRGLGFALFFTETYTILPTVTYVDGIWL